jgi:DNA-binding winged helix-turn-helix (wHTH) protein/TolB-like protein/cytochrome c-type biogenesis protein CcmH/NrfG
MTSQAKRLYQFGPFRLDAAERLLQRDGRPVPLTPKSFEVLLVLVENSGHIVEKDELIERVWSDTFVEEGNLKATVSMLRKALEDGAGERQYIETVPRRGYRFVPAVIEPPDEGAELILERHTRSRIVTEQEEQVEESPDKVLSPEVLWAPGPQQQSSGRRLSRALSIIILPMIGLTLIYALITNRGGRTEPRDEVKSIAVLPFRPLGLAGDDEHLGLGMADTLINKLSGMGGVIIRPVSAISRYTGLEYDPVAAGREQKVDAVLEGSIQKSGEKVRVTVRLISTVDGSALWTYKSDQQYGDTFAVQDSISQQLAKALTLRLNGEQEGVLRRHYTENAEAYSSYLKGRYYWSKRTPADLEKSIKHFERAIDLDPSYALAHAGLADSYAFLGHVFGQLPPAEAMPKARSAALKALELDEELAEAYASLGNVKLLYDWDFPGAQAAYNRSIELNPSYPLVHQFYAFYKAAVEGQIDQAVAEARRGLELDPLSISLNNATAVLLVKAGRFDEAIAQYREALEIVPSSVEAHLGIYEAYEKKGMFREAVDEYEKALKLLGLRLEEVGAYRRAYEEEGIRGHWRHWLRQALARWERGDRWHFICYAIARTYGKLEQKDEAIEWLEKAYKARTGALIWVGKEPDFDTLRSDLRFQDLLRRVGLRQ